MYTQLSNTCYSGQPCNSSVKKSMHPSTMENNGNTPRQTTKLPDKLRENRSQRRLSHGYREPHDYVPSRAVQLPGGSLPGTLRSSNKLPCKTLQPPDGQTPGTLRSPEQLPRENVPPPAGLFGDTLRLSDPTHGQKCSNLISKLRTKMCRRREDEKMLKSAEAVPSAVPPWARNPSTLPWLQKFKRCMKSVSLRIHKSKPTGEQPFELRPSMSDCHAIRTNGLFMPESTSSETDTLPQSQRSGETPATSETQATSTISSFNTAHTDFKKDYLQLKLHTIPLLAPQPFQCTFCLKQCSSKNDWLQHEKLTHFQEHEWTKTLDSLTREDSSSADWFIPSIGYSCDIPQQRPNTYSSKYSEVEESSNQRSLENVYSWFWTCGLCSVVLRSWDERQEHIAEHFEKGMTMACWDPLKSPYPWMRSSVTPVQGLPRWDLEELFAIQQPSLIDSLNG